jgi:hypothetical protein
MKKVSTATVKQSRKFSEQKLTIALDLGDRSSWYCVLDERGEVPRAVLTQRGSCAHQSGPRPDHRSP